MTEKRLVVTMALSGNSRKYSEVTFPLIQAYAKKCQADFHAFYQMPLGHDQVIYAKWAYKSFLSLYDRILHIDADMVVRSTTPDLFDLVPPDHFAGVDELPFQNLNLERPAVDRVADMQLMGGTQSLNPFYINVGMYLFSRHNSGIFDTMLSKNPCYFNEQSHINSNLNRHDKVTLLPPEYNYMKIMENAGLDKAKAHIIHYAGSYGGLPVDKVLEMMQTDIK